MSGPVSRRVDSIWEDRWVKDGEMDKWAWGEWVHGCDLPGYAPPGTFLITRAW